MKKRKSISISILVALLSCIALSASGEIVEQGTVLEYICREIRGIGIEYLLLLIGLSVFYYKFWDDLKKVKHWTINLLAFLFALFMLIGVSYSKYSGTKFITYSVQQAMIAGIVFVGYYILFMFCVKYIFYLLDRKHIWNIGEKQSLNAMVNKHYLLFAFLVIVICWLPYLVVHFPGSVPYDGYRQLNMYYGIEKISNHHPWIVTLIFGGLFQIGRNISDNFGVFLIVFVFYTIQAYCYAFVCNKIKRWNAPKWLRTGSVLFFAIVPVFGAYSQAVMKDGIFSAIFAVFITLYIECILKNDLKFSNKSVFKRYSALLLVEIMVCFTRNNGVYMVLAADLLLLIFVIKKRKKAAMFLMVSLCLSYYFIGNIVAGALGIADGSIKEMLSIPFQQTARYLRDYPDEVSKEEEEAIRKVLDYDNLDERYLPEISDHVKDSYRNAATKRELLSYFKAWFTMFLKHPEVYISATLNNTYGYYYPFYNCSSLGAYQFYIQGEPLATGEFDIHFVFSENIRKVIDKYAEAWRTLPGLAQLVNPGTYTWVILLFVGYLIYRKQWKRAIVLIPAALNIAVCIISPVNGYLRYALPLISCMPILVYWCFYKESEAIQE